MNIEELFNSILNGETSLSSITDEETFAALETFAREAGRASIEAVDVEGAKAWSAILESVKSARADFATMTELSASFQVEEVEEEVQEVVEETLSVEEEPAAVDIESLASGEHDVQVIEKDAPYHFDFMYRSNVSGRDPGEKVATRRDLANAVIKRLSQLSSRNPGIAENFEVARIDYSASMDVVAAEDSVGVAEQFSAIRNEAYNTAQRQSLTASGGICVAPQRFYDFCKINVPEGLVQSFLPSMYVPRGAITWYDSPDIRTAMAITGPAISETYTVANDLAGDSKTCVTFPCPTDTTAQIEAQYVCLQFGNIGARTFPEWVEHWIALSMDVHAHYVSAKLMADIVAAVDDTVTASDLAAYMGTLGVAATVFSTLDLAVADYRHDLKTGSSLGFEAIIPSWGYDMIRADLSKMGRVEGVSNAQIDSWFAQRNVTVHPVTDWVAVDDGQSPSVSAGAHRFSDEFPIIFYPRGTFVKLDMGTLDLGVVRDSTLNSTNDFQLFVETFESLAAPGCGDARRYIIPASVGGGFADNRAYDDTHTIA